MPMTKSFGSRAESSRAEATPEPRKELRKDLGNCTLMSYRLGGVGVEVPWGAATWR